MQITNKQLWSEEIVAFIETGLEYRANDIELRLNAPYPLPFLLEEDSQTAFKHQS